jgi:hypothetical protein
MTFEMSLIIVCLILSDTPAEEQVRNMKYGGNSVGCGTARQSDRIEIRFTAANCETSSPPQLICSQNTVELSSKYSIILARPETDV